LNDHLAETVASNPRQFLGLGTLPMQAPDLAVAELERIMKFPGIRGIQIGSHVGDHNLDSERFHPVWAAAERLGAAVFVHPWDMMGEKRMPDYFLPWLVGMPAETSLAICSMIFGGVFDRFPRLRVAFAHGGGAFPMTLGRIEQGFLTRPDLCAIRTKKNPRRYVGRFVLDTLVHDPDVLRFLLEHFGAKSLALGSDYPFPLGEKNPGQMIRKMKLPAATRQQLLSGTAKRWLGIR
jgi:aminocarboxymuconate-semialdehyde decarboxylase